MFIITRRNCLSLRFTLVFVFLNLQAASQFFSWAMSSSHCSFVWDSQVKELHFTAPSLKQHCTQLQDKRCECVSALKSIDVSVRLHPNYLTFFCLFFFFTSNFCFSYVCFNRFDMVEWLGFVWDTMFLRPLPKSPPIHRMLVPPCSVKIRGFKIKPCDVPIFPSLRICKNSAQGLVPLYV